MKIQQISTNIDLKVQALDKKIQQLHAQMEQSHQAANSSVEHIQKDIHTLENIKHKLTKSQTLMWQAHEIRQGSDIKQLKRTQMMALLLCGFSVMGLLVLAWLALH